LEVQLRSFIIYANIAALGDNVIGIWALKFAPPPELAGGGRDVECGGPRKRNHPNRICMAGKTYGNYLAVSTGIHTYIFINVFFINLSMNLATGMRVIISKSSFGGYVPTLCERAGKSPRCMRTSLFSTSVSNLEVVQCIKANLNI
jgi:hypothetical protein